MRRTLLQLLAIIAAMLLVLTACSSDDDGDSADDAAAEDEAADDSAAEDEAADDGAAEDEAADDSAAEDEAADDSGEDAAAATGEADQSVFDGTTVGIISLAPGLEPVDRIQEGVVECVDANGGSTQVFDAAGGTEAVQAFEQANAAGVDAIYNIANDVSSGTLDAGLAEAGDAGRPVVTAWGGQANGTVAITGLEFQSSARVGQYLIDRLAAANDGVPTGNVLVVNARVTPSLRQRADAFTAMVGPDTEFPDIEVTVVEVDISNALADAQAKVEQAIQANPDINAVYATFDTLGQGAATAVDSGGGDQFVVSFNGDSTALDMIRDGGSFVATAANDLEGTATLACDVLATMLAGGTPAATTFWMDSPLVTDVNVPAEGFATGPGPFLLYQPEGATTSGGDTESSSEAIDSEADQSVFDGTTVGIISLAPGLEPVDRIQEGVVECVDANGGSTQVFDAAGGTEAVQAFEQANAAGVDAIYNIANDVSSGTLDAGLAEAGDAGRPVVTAWGGQANGTVAITGLEFQSSARVGQYLIDRLAAANDGVPTGNVLVVNARVTPSLRQRADAFTAMVGPDTEFPDIEVTVVEVDISNALADAQAKVEQAIQANPDINAVYATFDTLGQGAATAVDSGGGDQFVVSFNGDSTALDMIRDGGSFVATAANDLEGTATLACDVLATMLAGGTPAATTFWMDSPLVTDVNVPAEGFATGPGPFLLYQPAS